MWGILIGFIILMVIGIVMKWKWLIAGVVSAFIGMIIGLFIGADIGGNYFVNFVFAGQRGYEATGILGAMIGGLLGGISGSLFVWKLTSRKGSSIPK